MQTAIILWLLRRLLEIGGAIGVGASLLAQIDPIALNQLLLVTGKLLTGNFEDINLGTLIATGSLVGGLGWNLFSTFRSQVVLKGKSVPIKELPTSTKKIVETSVESITARRPTIFDRFFKRE